MSELHHLFAPLRLGATEIPNRIVSTAHQTTLIADHLPTDDFVAYHEARARGGTGLIVLEASAIHPTGLLTSHTLGGYLDEVVAGYRRVSDAVHRHGARVFVQLFHGGREQITGAPRAPAVAPSSIPSQRYHVEPRALTDAEIEEVIDGYARAAHLAVRGGLDGVEISAAHTYLIAQFFTPELNDRTDRWGEDGTLFCRRVLEAVRSGADGIAVGMRFSGDSGVAAGVAAAVAADLDYISVALGDASTPAGAVWIVPPPPAPENAVSDVAQAFRLGPPLIITSRIVDPVAADSLLGEGRADAVGMTRALIADPDMPRKARSDRCDDLLRCIGCNVCIARYHADAPISCAQNPRTGRERALPPPACEAASARRRFVIAGAGPAGLAAAHEAATRGHDVVVLEQAGEIGGQMRVAAAAPGTRAVATALIHNYRRLLRSSRVELVPGRGADASTVAALDPDVIILATGARPYRPSLPLDDVEVLSAWDVLTGARPQGRVVIADWGGDSAGLDCAEVLAGEGRPVTLVVDGLAVGETVHQYRRGLYLERLYRAGVTMEHHQTLVGAQDGHIRFRNAFARGLECTYEADALVLALGRVPETGLAAQLRDLGVPVLTIGDAAGPRTLEEAILEGTLAVAEQSATAPMPALERHV